MVLLFSRMSSCKYGFNLSLSTAQHHTSVGIVIVRRAVTLTKTMHPAALVRNTIWDIAVGSYSLHLYTHAHIPSSGNYAEIIRIDYFCPLSRYLFLSPVGLFANRAAWPN